MKTRAERRHHHERMMNKVKQFGLYDSFSGDEEEKIEHQRKMTETRKPCSCWMCGNPRKHSKDKYTMQEKRAFEQTWNDYEDE